MKRYLPGNRRARRTGRALVFSADSAGSAVAFVVARLALFFLVAAAACSHLPPLNLSPSELVCRQVVPPTATVRWSGPADSRSRSALPGWCATIGPVVFNARAPSASQAADRLAIVSWNVHGGEGDLDELITRLRRGDFTGGESVVDFVLLLQETYRRGELIPAHVDRRLPMPHRLGRSARAPRDDVTAIAERHGLALFYAPAMRNGAGDGDPEDRGNAMASSFAMTDAQVLELPLEHQRRIVPIVTVEGWRSNRTPWRVRIADAHFDTGLAIAHGGPFRARRHQAQAVIDALAGRGLAVAAGDFNTWFGDREPAIASLRAAFPQTPAVDGLTTWRGPLGLHARLDYVFVRGAGSVVVRRLPDRLGSDHYPLLALLEL